VIGIVVGGNIVKNKKLTILLHKILWKIPVINVDDKEKLKF